MTVARLPAAYADDAAAADDDDDDDDGWGRFHCTVRSCYPRNEREKRMQRQ